MIREDFSNEYTPEYCPQLVRIEGATGRADSPPRAASLSLPALVSWKAAQSPGKDQNNIPKLNMMTKINIILYLDVIFLSPF